MQGQMGEKDVELYAENKKESNCCEQEQNGHQHMGQYAENMRKSNCSIQARSKQHDSTNHAVHGGDIYRHAVTCDFSVNINPLPLPEVLQERIVEAAVQCNRYPEYENRTLREKLAATEHLEPEEVLCGNGASELFAAIVHAFHPKRVAIPAPSFYGYTWSAQMENAQICYIPLLQAENYKLKKDLFSYLDGTDMLFLANPANPVGNQADASLIEALLLLCKQKQILVVLDECFLPFTGEHGFASRIEEFPNLIVVRAFTKIFRIPGIRLGYLFAQKTLCEKIARQLPEWNLSVIAQRVGMDFLDDALEGWDREKYLSDTIQLIKQEKEYLIQELTKILGRKAVIFPSDANFFMLKTDEPLYQMLLERGILIRDCSNYAGLGKRFYRLAVKGHEENKKLILALKESIANWG